METGLYEIIFKDGRIFRVFTANKKQKERLFNFLYNNKKQSKLELVKNGIHTIKQFENIMSWEKEGKK